MAPVVRNVHMEACCHALRNQVPMKALPGRYVCKFVVSLAFSVQIQWQSCATKSHSLFQTFAFFLRTEQGSALTGTTPTLADYPPETRTSRRIWIPERERERNWHALLRGEAPCLPHCEVREVQHCSLSRASWCPQAEVNAPWINFWNDKCNYDTNFRSACDGKVPIAWNGDFPKVWDAMRWKVIGWTIGTVANLISFAAGQTVPWIDWMMVWLCWLLLEIQKVGVAGVDVVDCQDQRFWALLASAWWAARMIQPAAEFLDFSESAERRGGARTAGEWYDS